MKKIPARFSVGENDIKAADIPAVNGLLRQLNPDASEIDYKKIKEVMRYGVIMTIRDSSQKNVLIGMGTLIPLRKIFSFSGTIEDVVVSEECRGQGLGRKIMQVLLDKSRSLGMKCVDLTSRPQRKIANQLYQSIGFERRKTNVYRFSNK
ncbi:MAG: GNAT family N-acetyltransferase [Candidatus Moranbacteria bacterium]|nr:GNAT family N-acetyltransferase [Candidatus Moranbacteria bacterium]